MKQEAATLQGSGSSLPTTMKRRNSNDPYYFHTLNKIFLGSSLEEAEIWVEDLQGEGSRPQESYDIWEVDLSKINVKQGRMDPYGENSFYISGVKIPPSSLTLVKTIKEG